jgi:hypothetical protein
MSKSIEVDGQEVSVGDDVCFKEDYERCGEVKRICGKYLDIEYVIEEEFERMTTKHVNDCWVE